MDEYHLRDETAAIASATTNHAVSTAVTHTCIECGTEVGSIWRSSPVRGACPAGLRSERPKPGP